MEKEGRGHQDTVPSHKQHMILCWCGSVVDVSKLRGVCSQVVELPNAPLVFYVLAATIGKDTRVSGCLPTLFRLMGLQQDGSPPVEVGGGPCEEGLQGAPVDVAWAL